jgi:hypothetical protein
MIASCQAATAPEVSMIAGRALRSALAVVTVSAGRKAAASLSVRFASARPSWAVDAKTNTITVTPMTPTPATMARLQRVHSTGTLTIFKFL